MFAEFLEITPTTWIAIATLIALAVILLIVSHNRRTLTIKALSSGALCMALSFILSYIKLPIMPAGGSVTAASMLPLMLYAAAFGTAPGLLAGLGYGLLQYLQGGYFLNPWQFLLDYPLAFAALGLAGIKFSKLGKFGLYASMTVAVLGRALCATLAGFMFWDTSVWGSIVYNATYLLPELVICLALAIAVAPRLLVVMRKQP